MWARRPFLLGALAMAGALSMGVADGGARAQPLGRAFGARLIQIDRERGQERREERRDERGGGRGNQGDQGERGDRGEGRGGYRGQPYPPAPRGYGYPEPPPAYPYPERAPPPAYAQPPQAYGYAPVAPRQNSVPLGQAMANIRRVAPGRILDAWTEAGPDGRQTYRVRWAAQGGKRIDFIVDAATGAIIGQSGY